MISNRLSLYSSERSTQSQEYFYELIFPNQNTLLLTGSLPEAFLIQNRLLQLSRFFIFGAACILSIYWLGSCEKSVLLLKNYLDQILNLCVHGWSEISAWLSFMPTTYATQIRCLNDHVYTQKYWFHNGFVLAHSRF